MDERDGQPAASKHHWGWWVNRTTIDPIPFPILLNPRALLSPVATMTLQIDGSQLLTKKKKKKVL
jgi:hypothetical protein